MSIDYDALENPTDSQLLKAVRHAIVQLTLSGQSVSIAGVSYSRADLGKLLEAQRELEARIAGVDTPFFVFTRNKRV